MNEVDRQTRKRWLILLVLSVLNSVFAFLLEFKYNPVNQNIPPNLLYWMLLVSVCSAGGFAYITYRCAYKKPGTKLLTVFLVLSVLVLAINPILYLTGKLPVPTYIPYYQIYLFSTQVFGVVWLGTCWQLRKLNRRLQMSPRAS